LTFDIYRIWVDLVAEEDEFVFGGGEQFTYLNLRGRVYPIWVREQGVGRNLSSDVTQVKESSSKLEASCPSNLDAGGKHSRKEPFKQLVKLFRTSTYECSTSGECSRHHSPQCMCYMNIHEHT
jgi:hypothetical protein